MASARVLSLLVVTFLLSVCSSAAEVEPECGSCPKTTHPKLPLPPVAVPTLPIPKISLPPVTVGPKLPIPPVTGLPKVGLPPVTGIPKVGLPPVTGLPKVGLPPVTGLPKVGLPPVTVIPKIGLPPVTVIPKIGLPPVAVIPKIGLPPVTTPTHGAACPPPPAKTGTCPINTLKLGACVDILGGLVHVGLGDPAVHTCCPVISGLVELEAAACLCTTLKIKALDLNIYLPIALELLISCGKTPPPGFTCTL